MNILSLKVGVSSRKKWWKDFSDIEEHESERLQLLCGVPIKARYDEKSISLFCIGLRSCRPVRVLMICEHQNCIMEQSKKVAWWSIWHQDATNGPLQLPWRRDWCSGGGRY